MTYVITYHPLTHARRAAQREGVIDYERKTISIVWREDRFKDVEALERAVFRAALWERGSRDTDQWKIDEWVSLSEGIFASLFHDNPEFVRYLAAGHAEK